jgi:hypothetical protein
MEACDDAFFGRAGVNLAENGMPASLFCNPEWPLSGITIRKEVA